MCGVAAIFAYHYAATPLRREELIRMSDHMRRRGPDGEGFWYSTDGRVGLAHRRLAIIDLDSRAAQPMVSACGRYRISFNGEIYNYPELRRELVARGVMLRTQSDTEVLLELFALDGVASLTRLRGMFAFVMHDEKLRKLWLVRDPYGIKPLYYADDGWTVRIASQVKALLASKGVSRQPDAAGHAGYLLWGSVPDPFTCYRAISAVPAGSVIEVTELGPSSPSIYQTLSECYLRETPDLGTEHLEAQIRAAIRSSVRAHQIADVPVGAFLSGGVDSGAVVGLMAHDHREPIKSATILFERFRNTPYDEAALANALADRYGTDHVLRTIDETEIEADMPAFLDAMDQPSIDGINVWFAAKACAERGLRVAMSGIGGDELLAGYPSFASVPRWHQWAWLPAKVPGLGRLTRMLGQPIIESTTNLPGRAAGFIELAGTYSGAYLLRRGLFMPWELPGLMGDEPARDGLARLRPLRRVEQAIMPDPKQSFARVSSMESALYLRNQLLRDCDWAAMAHSLEVRTPLVDIELLKEVAPLLTHPGAPIRKSLLASCPEPTLPMTVVNRPKTGFATPMAHSDWLGSRTAGSGDSRAAAVSQSPARSFARWILASHVGE